MRIYYSDINKIRITVALDQELYIMKKALFDYLFAEYHQLDDDNFDENSMPPLLYLHLPSNYVRNISARSKSYECNPNNEQWVYWMLYELEEWYAHCMKCTIFHASGIILDDVKIIILGNSMCGKSTLTAYLCCEKGASFLDDDSVYYLDNYCYGFHIPMAMRNNIVDYSKWHICNTCDATYTRRSLVGWERTVSSFHNVDVILFPQYNTEEKNFITEISGGQLFQKLMSHIRNSHNMKSLLRDINYIVQNCKAYQVCYTTCENAYELLQSVYKDSEE